MDLESQETQHAGVELRVLHGPQAGSRLPLMPGAPYLIGAGDACDIMLAGAQVETEHAQLEVDESHWSIAPAQGRALRLDGTVCEANRPLEFGDVVQLGRVKISVDLQGADWPEDEALEPQPRPEPEPEPEPDALASGAAPPPEDAEAQDAAPSPAPAPVRRPRWVRRWLALLAFVAVAGGSLTLVAYAAWQASQPAPEAPEVAEAPKPADAPPAPPPEPTPAQRMQEWLQRQQASTTARLVLEGDGQQTPWRLSGHVRREEDRQRLQDATRELPWPVEIAVLTLDERIAALRRHLAQLPWAEDLSLRLIDAGRDNPRVRVISASQSRADTAIAQMRQALRAIEPIETEVLLPSALRQRFMARLDGAGLGKRFETVRAEPDLALRALLSQHEVAQWERAFVDFTAEYGSVLRISAVIRTERDAIEAKIRAVVSGAYPYVMTTSGQRVAPGGSIDGRTVLAVNAQEVVFADGLRVRLRP